MVDLGNFSTKYTQGAGQEIKIIDNKAMLRAPYCLQSCPVFFVLFVFCFVRLFVFFIPDENSFGQQAMTDAHTGGWHHLVGKRGMGGAECSLGGNCAGLPGPRWVRAGAWWGDGRGTINQVQFEYSLETQGTFSQN